MAAVYISGFGVQYPAERVTNHDLAQVIDTTHEWIVERTGIEERRRVGEGETTASLAAGATRAALETVPWRPAELDLLICATSSPDAHLPSVAAHTAQALTAEPVAFDVNAACAGLAYGAATARSMMLGMGYRRAALCCADTYTRYIDYGDRRSAVLFGDSAATLLLQPERPERGAEIVDVYLENRSDVDLVRVPLGGTWQMEGPKVKAPALDMMLRCTERLLDRNGLSVHDLRAFIAHQANYRMLEGLAETLGVSEEQHWSNVQRFGNQGAAGAATVLCEGVAANLETLRDGDMILITVVGSGLTAGAVLLRWVA